MTERSRFVIETLTRKILIVESILIGLTVAAVAYADGLAGPSISLGFLFLVPLSYSALSHPWPVTMALVVACIALRQRLGPVELATWTDLIRDWVLTGIFLSVVTTLFRLGKDRRAFFDSARRQRDSLLAEMKIAADVQGRILSRNLPPETGWDIRARSWPAQQVGGDYYDFKKLPDDRIYMVVADVAGKGLPAALLMPAVQIANRALLEGSQDLADMLGKLNQVVFESTDDAAYVTLFVAVLDPVSSRLRYVNAGHVPPLWWQNEEKKIQWLNPLGPPIGLLENVRHETQEIKLAPDDFLIACTDGVIEAADAAGQDFGQEGLSEAFLASPRVSSSDTIETIRRAVDAHTLGQGAQDDLTLVCLRAPRQGAAGAI